MKKQEENTNFGADEIISKPEVKKSNMKDIKLLIEEKKDTFQLDKSKFNKLFQLNSEGLKLYGQYKKQQLWNTIKWSFLGTLAGFFVSIIIDRSFKKMNTNTKDYFKGFMLIGCIGVFTFQGMIVSSHEFAKKQNMLIEKYGREVE